MKAKLTVNRLKQAARAFCAEESFYENKELFGVTDGKAVGTYIEHKFLAYLDERFIFGKGSSAKGIDLPDGRIMTDIKVTSIKQPQSSCPFKDAQQKIFGLGYNLLVFVYEKSDDTDKGTAVLNFMSCTFLDRFRTADYSITYRLREMIKDGANKEDVVAYLNDRNIPADGITLDLIADRVLNEIPEQGYLTISNALQWRLQYGRIVTMIEERKGITKLVDKVNE